MHCKRNQPNPVAAIDKTVEQPKRAESEQAVTNIRVFVQSTKRNLNFSIDDSTARVAVKVIATESGVLIRQLS
jgi:flagellar protein FlaG